MSSDDPLQNLVVDAVEMDRQRIADALGGVLVIDKEGRVVPVAGFDPLPAVAKILAYLLGRKVAVLLNLSEEEPISPKGLEEGTGMPGGTVRARLREMREERLVSQDVDARYYLSSPQVSTAISRIGPSESADGDSGSPQNSDETSRGSRPAQRKSTTGSKKNAGGGGGGFSPTEAVRDLIGDGFFATPKTLSDVQTQLKEKQGRNVEVTSLSPIFTRLLRSGDLDRTRNQEGVYEYTAAAEQ